MFCSACGAQIADGSAHCSVCGAAQVPAQQPYQQPMYQQPMYQQPLYGVKPKIPGKGMGVASLVLGIIGLVYGLYFFWISTILNEFGIGGADFEDLLSPMIFLFGLNIPAVALGVVSKNKGYNGVNKAGLVLGILGLVFSVLMIIVLMS